MDSSSSAGGTKRRGYTMSRRTAFLLVGAVVVALVATGLLVHQLSQCSLPRDAETPMDALVAKSSITAPPKVRDVRLPRAVVPQEYYIRLLPFIWEGNFTFNGDVDILVNVTEPTNNVTLHINEIDIHPESVAVKGAEDNSLVPVEDLSFDVARHFAILHLAQPLEPGRQYRVMMSFVGKLNNALQGFYRSSYKQDNQTRWIATTQFQPTDARRAFPCFDEPALKAKFTISLGRPKNMSSISNMPRRDGPQPVEGMPDYEWDHYYQSVPMSTYLVAFIVFDFERLGNESFSVWARKEAIQQAEYSLSLGPRILSFYEEYFHIRFPLPKMDMVALPDFSAGAMENWGLVTYRETAMLYQPGISTNQNRQGVAVVVAHELAHQWFGNLVTPSWWSDLWLNEGFATYVETLGVNAVEPTWKILEQFVIQDLQNIFALDALKSSHPISIEVGHPDEISEIFDGISYSKGASIIRMMDHFLTTEVFKRGITNYLNKWAYRSSTQNDLWNELTAQGHADGALDLDVTIKEIMDTWTLQTGFPVVTVIRNYRSRGATISQERFLLQSMKGSKPSEQLWWVPLSFTDSEKLDFETTRPKYWMKAQKYVTLPTLEASPDSWVIFNIKETGFYRVNYDPTNWQMLIATLQNPNSFEQITTINRAQLIDDSLNLARAGLLDYGTALEVTRYLEHELEYLPWKAAFNALSYIDNILIKTGSYNAFRMYMMKLIQRLYDHTGFTDNPTDPQLTVYKRISVLNWACTLGHEDCVRNSVVLFQNWRSAADPDKTNPISGNLKNVVYCTAIRVGGQEEWDFAWQRYRNTNVGSERDLLLSALGCTREIWLLTRYLDWSLTEHSGIRKQDTPRVFSAVARNVIGQPLAYSFVRNKWDYIRDYLGSSQFSLTTIMRSATKKISTKFEYEDLLKFAETNRNQLGSAARALEQALELAETNVAWVSNYQDVVTQWLNNVTAITS